MKRFWLAAALLALIAGGCVLNARYARDLTRSLTGQLVQSGRLAETGDWQQALSLTEHAARQWEDARVWRCVFLSRGDTDQISHGFLRVQLFLRCRELSRYLPENADLILQLTGLGGTEQLLADNIL